MTGGDGTRRRAEAPAHAGVVARYARGRRRLRRARIGDRLHRAHAANQILRTVISAPEPLRRQPLRAMPARGEFEADPRLRQVVRTLVRTMRSCPAPGVAPLTWRDWLILGSVVVVPYVLLVGGIVLAGRH